MEGRGEEDGPVAKVLSDSHSTVQSGHLGTTYGSGVLFIIS